MPAKLKVFSLTVPLLLLVFFTVYFTFTLNDISVEALCSPMPPSPPQSPQIVQPAQCEQVSGNNVRILVNDPMAQKIDLYLHADGHLFPCWTIATDIPPKSPGVFEKFWNSSEVVDFDNYRLVVKAKDSTTIERWSMIAIGTQNNKTGSLCQPPVSSGDNGSPGSGSTGGSSGGSSGSGGSNPSSKQVANNTEVDFSGTKGSAQAEGEKESAGEAEEALVEESIPLTIDSFDPNIFLSGGAVSISKVERLAGEKDQFLQFTGSANPNKLVTLYIFSNATVAVVKSDSAGKWLFSKTESIAPGKHTAFATVYENGVTRKSKIIDFFVSSKSSPGNNLILGSSNLKRFYPYAIALSVTVFSSIITLVLYIIFSKRRASKP